MFGSTEPRSSFFFSSIRRHTGYWRDWSSDVCSSDLSSRLGDHRDGIGGEPDRGLLDRGAWIGIGKRVLPHAAPAGELLGEGGRVRQHGLLHQPLNVRLVVAGGLAGPLGAWPPREERPQPRARPQPRRAGRVELLVVGDIAGLVTLAGGLQVLVVAHEAPVYARGPLNCPQGNRPARGPDPHRSKVVRRRRSSRGRRH